MDDDLFSRPRLAGHLPEVMRGMACVCAGAGALGQNFLMPAAMEGFGRLRIVDADLWSDSNATRSPCYGNARLRRRCQNSKAATVAHELRRITAWNPELRIEYAHCWVQELGDAPFREASVVVSCVDDLAARAYLMQMCHLHGKPLIEGGIDGSAGCFAVYTNPDGPCWQCGVPVPTGVRVPAGCQANAIEQERQGIQPMTQSICAVLGAYMAKAAIQLAHGDEYLAGRRVYVSDVGRPAIRAVSESRASNCPCPHAPFGQAALQLRADNSSTVGELLAELAAHFAEPRVLLRSPFILREVCPGPLDDPGKSCGAVIDVWASEWRLRRHPRCRSCGGEHRQATQGNLAVAQELTTFDEDLQGLPVGQFGFAAGDWLAVEDRVGLLAYAALSGSSNPFRPVGQP